MATPRIIVPTDTPGFQLTVYSTRSATAAPIPAFLFFDDVRVPVDEHGWRPQPGLPAARWAQFQDERLVPVVTSPVSARHLWELTLAHAQQRVVFGQPLAVKMKVNRLKFVVDADPDRTLPRPSHINASAKWRVAQDMHARGVHGEGLFCADDRSEYSVNGSGFV